MAEKPKYFDEIKETVLKQNGGLFTIFAIALIVGSGITLVDDPSRWWISLLAIGFFCLVIFLFINARVIIKSIISIIIVLLEASYAFKIGVLYDPTEMIGSLWLFAILFTFFTCLSISYILPSNSSRWGVATIATFISFSTTLILLGAFEDNRISILIGVITAITIFVLWYRWGSKSFYSQKNMPVIDFEEEFYDFYDEVTKNAWGVKPITKKGEIKAALVWNDTKAFVVTTVHLEQKLGLSGRKKMYLSYKGKNINPWLLAQAFTLVPHWRLKNADILLVFLDRKNKNGLKSKVIGVEVPDSNRKLPVGIYPAKNFIDKRKYTALLENMSKEFDEFIIDLNDSQRDALDRLLPPDDNDDESVKEVS